MGNFVGITRYYYGLAAGVADAFWEGGFCLDVGASPLLPPYFSLENKTRFLRRCLISIVYLIKNLINNMNLNSRILIIR